MSDYDYMIEAAVRDVRTAARAFRAEVTLARRQTWERAVRHLRDLLEMEIDPPHCRRCDRALTPDLIAGREGSMVWCESCMQEAARIAQEDPSPRERRQMRVDAARERQDRSA